MYDTNTCFVQAILKLYMTFHLLAETTGEILQTTLRSYLKVVHRKDFSLASNESYSFSLHLPSLHIIQIHF